MEYKLQNFAIKLKYAEPYKPSFLTELLGNKIEIKKNSIAADIGTGCGILAILASKLGAKKVYAIDVDRECRKTIEANSSLNNASNVIFIQGSMLKPLKEKVDVIIANLPQTPSDKKIDFHRYGSADGTRYNAELIKNAPRCLKKNGLLFFSLMSISNPLKILRLLKNRFDFSLIAAKEREFDKKRFEKLSKGLGSYILGLNKKDKAILFYRNKRWHYLNYIIKARLK